MKSRVARKVLRRYFEGPVTYRKQTMRRMWRWLFRHYPAVKAQFEKRQREGSPVMGLLELWAPGMYNWSNVVLSVGGKEIRPVKSISYKDPAP